MDRRAFTTSLISLALSSAIRAQQCVPIGQGAVGCETAISFDEVVLAATLQHCPMWCWAASTVAIFKFFGHSVDQEAVVMSTYGQLACVGAQRPIQIAQSLSRVWTDDDGDRFRLHITAAYDPMSGINAINNAIIINELNNGRPLIYCNTHHAMVVCAAAYRSMPMGIAIDGLTVVDPWPYSPRIHGLSTPEFIPIHLGGQMTFLASVAISDV